MLYNYIPKQQPDSGGTRDYAFNPSFTNPLFGMFGPATPIPVNVFSAVQPEQVYYNQRQYLQGLIGVIAGQIAMQPLIDTRGITG
jgi:hypothetical protein